MPRKGFKKSEEQIQKDREAAIKRHHGEDIKYLSDTHPDIAKEWHTTKNNNKQPTQFTKSSDAKIIWLCPNTCKEGCPHEYESTIYNRTNGHGCPFCSKPRRKICIHDSIVHTHPDIAKEWHPTKNIDSTAETTCSGSSKHVWWLCSNICSQGCLHEYKNSPNNRIGVNKQNCPFCCNQQICFHSSIEYTHPDIAKEWHTTKNGNKIPSQYSKGCTKKFWWKCNKNHEYEASIHNRTSHTSGCPMCKRKTELKLYDYIIKQIPDIKIQVSSICPKKFYDYVSETLKVIIELDGPQHFNFVSNWKNSPDINQDADVYKMKIAVNKGYRIIRILQEDVFKNNEEWLDIHLKPLLEKGNTVEYICPNNENIYSNHRTKLNIIQNVSK